MATGKEIKRRIKSVKSTKKITKAMEMVAASKMKKVQESMIRSRPYSEKIKDVIKNVGEEISHRISFTSFLRFITAYLTS